MKMYWKKQYLILKILKQILANEGMFSESSFFILQPEEQPSWTEWKITEYPDKSDVDN